MYLKFLDIQQNNVLRLFVKYKWFLLRDAFITMKIGITLNLQMLSDMKIRVLRG